MDHFGVNPKLRIFIRSNWKCLRSCMPCVVCVCVCVCVSALFSFFVFPSVKTNLHKSSFNSHATYPTSPHIQPPLTHHVPLPGFPASCFALHPKKHACWNYSVWGGIVGNPSPPSQPPYLPSLALFIFFSFRYRFAMEPGRVYFILMLIKQLSVLICISSYSDLSSDWGEPGINALINKIGLFVLMYFLFFLFLAFTNYI